MPTARTVSADDFTALAREAFGASGLTQAQAAERLGVSQPSVAKALAGASNLLGLRVRMVEEFGAYEVEGPQWCLTPKHRGAETP